MAATVVVPDASVILKRVLPSADERYVARAGEAGAVTRLSEWG